MSSEKEYVVERFRFVILLLFMFISIMNQINWITFAPIQNSVASVYGVESDLIQLLALVFMVVYIPINFPATYLLDKYGLKWGTGIGVVLTGVFSLLRAFSGTSFAFLMFNQTMIAIGQPFLLNSFTKVAVNWFPENEKTTAAGIGTIAVLVGIMLGMVLTPILYESNGIDYTLMIYGALSFIAMILYLIFVKNEPESPPSNLAGSKVFDFRGMRDLFKIKQFNYLLLLIFIGLGAFNAISAVIDDIFVKFSSDPNASGFIGGIMLAGGIIGAAIISTLSDYLRKRKIFLVIAMLTAVPLSILLITFESFTLVMITSFLFGFFLVSALPVALILAAEITYPVSEEASNGLMMTLGQVSGILFALAFNMYVIAGLFAVAFIFSLFLKDVNTENMKT